MIVLGIDAATKTGWAIYDSDKKAIIESGVEDFSKKRGESNGIMFLRFRKWMADILKMAPAPQIVSYEQSHHRGGAATEICVNLTGRIQEICSQSGIECATVQTRSLKKYATGKGNASKEEMMEAAKQILGREPIDDNEADAVLIAKWAAEEYF
ncbi:MAG: hypothetical protein HQK78_03185 [Desulfobacterales bacterium]|nr:hypothetical protein [Desulfobacterales bacterium]